MHLIKIFFFCIFLFVCFFFVCFVLFLSLVQWQIVGIKTSFMHTLGKGKERFISPERRVGRGLAWQLCKQLLRS